MEDNPEVDAVNTNLVANLDAPGVNEALTNLENVLEATRDFEVQSEVSFDNGNESLDMTQDDSMTSNGSGAYQRLMVTRRQRCVARPVASTTASPRVGGLRDGIACTGDPS